MRKRLAYRIGLVLGLLLPGCSGSGSFEGFESDYSDSFIAQKVKVYIGDPQEGIDVQSTVKGSGPIDAAMDLKGKSFKIYAFSTAPDVSYQSGEGAPDAQTAPACLVDGRMAELKETGTAASWVATSGKEQEPEYPRNELSNASYHFYATYLDNLSASSIKKSPDKVECTVRIDGTQDIMSSQAPGAYSYVSSRENRHPIFQMEHQLVKFHFRIKPGVTPGLQKWMRVESLTMAFQSEVRVKLAARDGDLSPAFSGSPASFPLICISSGKALSAQEDVRVQTFEDASLFSDGMIRHLASERDAFLVPPADEYTYVLTLSEAASGPDGQPLSFGTPVSSSGKTIRRADGEPFKAGSAYTVTFTVFGQNEVAVFVTEMEAWNTDYSQWMEFSDLDE